MNSMKRYKPNKIIKKLVMDENSVYIHGKRNACYDMSLRETFGRYEKHNAPISTDLIEISKDYINKLTSLIVETKLDFQNEILESINLVSKSFDRITLCTENDDETSKSFHKTTFVLFEKGYDTVKFENIYYTEREVMYGIKVKMSYPFDGENGMNVWRRNYGKYNECHKCQGNAIIFGYCVIEYNNDKNKTYVFPLGICDGTIFVSNYINTDLVMGVMVELYATLPVLFPIREDYILHSKTSRFESANSYDPDKPNVIYPKANRYIYLSSECENEVYKAFNHRHTNIWWVRGHQRKCSDGRTTWVKGHWRGPDKELGENSPDIKTRIRKLPELLTIDESDTTAFSFSEDEIEEDDGFYLDD